jgi:ATP-dependent Clp protease ATP-binding subunit ClpA
MSDRDRFDKFTERARRVLSLAQEEAQRFQHNYIGTEHLLLGLVREGEGVAAKVLSNLGVELYRVRNAVEFIIGRGDRIVLGEIGLTPRAKKVIELAVDEARRLNHHYIGTEHLLLGLVREGSGIAAGVLESLGVNLEKVRTQTIQVLSQSGAAQTMETAAISPPSQTEAVKKVLSLAQEESQFYQHDYVGTEHLLLGLVREGDGVAAKVLSKLGAELEKVRSAVEFIVKRGEHTEADERVLTRRAMEVMADATFEARRLKHDYVGTEHVLLGLVRSDESIAVAVLRSMGVKMETVRTAVMETINQT